MSFTARDDLYGFQEIIDEAVKRSRKTKEKVRLEFPKAQFFEQYPSAINDPRVVAFQDEVVIEIEQFESITVGELRKLCTSVDNKNSQLALEKRKSILAFEDERRVLIPHHEIKALKEGKAKAIVVIPDNVPETAPIPPPAKPTPEEVLANLKKDAPEPKGGLSVEAPPKQK